MLMKELISSCSHAPIAEAAVISIGPAFHQRVARVARREDMSVGSFAAQAVRAFRAQATAADWRELSEICAGEDMPILRGLHHILERALEDGHTHSAGRRSMSACSDLRSRCA